MLFLLAAVAFLGWQMSRRNQARPQPNQARSPSSAASLFPFESAGSLFSPAERSFLGVLEQSVGAELRVLGKVRLADLIQPAAGLAAGDRGAAFNRISRKHVDFVLCCPRTLAVVAVVELDDRSHQRADRRERDALVDGALSAAGITVLHVPCRQGYNVTELRESILRVTTPPQPSYGSAPPLRLAS